jgi:hypothetical protein
MTIGLLALDRRHGPLLAAAFRQISENGKRKTEFSPPRTLFVVEPFFPPVNLGRGITEPRFGVNLRRDPRRAGGVALSSGHRGG